jgi:hypothetical protein
MTNPKDLGKMSLDTPPATPAEGHASGAAISFIIGRIMAHFKKGISFETIAAPSTHAIAAESQCLLEEQR